MTQYMLSEEAWQIYSRFMKAKRQWEMPQGAQLAIVHADGFYESYSFLANEKHACKSLVGMRTEKKDEGGSTLTRTLLWSEGLDFPGIVQLEYEQRRHSNRNFGRVFGAIGMGLLLGNFLAGHPMMMEAPVNGNFELAMLSVVGAVALSLLDGWIMGLIGQTMVVKPEITYDKPNALSVSFA